MNSPFFLTQVAEDWPESNLVVLQESIFNANQAALDRTNVAEDPLLDNPNLANVRGVLRWSLLQTLLEQAVKSHRFDGIHHRWVDLGGVNVLELRGRYTRVTPCHLLSKDDVPRESVYRKSTRIENQVYQSLFGFEQPEEEDRLFNLLLVHGGRHETFAFLRAYCDHQDRRVYLQLSQNIMLLPSLLQSIDYEDIQDPQIGLNQDANEEEGGTVGEAGR